MDRVIYTALTSLTARQRAQAVTANNLANTETIGFRREIVAAEGRYLRGPADLGAGSIARAQTGSPSLATPLVPGRTQTTGRPLDIALMGDAWLAIAAPPEGGTPREAYTRRGDLQVSATGQLVLGDGRVPLDTNGAPIQVPANGTLRVGADGTLTALIEGQEQPVARLKLVAGGSKETGFDKGADGQFTTPAPLPADPSARLAPGALELSNVSAAQGLVELVEQSRAFEAGTRLMRTARELDEAGTRLLRLE
jgi:flagellar basal-body rod protein FlgF